MRYLVLILVMLLAPVLSAAAPDFAGDWLGTLPVQPSPLRLLLHVSRDAKGVLSATLDSLDQGANGLPVDSITASGNSLELTMTAIGATYNATLDPDAKRLKGTFKQGPNVNPLELVRQDPSKAKAVKPSLVDGDWNGTLDAGGQKLRLAFHFANTSEGLTASLRSIDQGNTQIPIGKVSLNGNKLHVEVPIVNGGFEGTLNSAGDEIAGTWTQGAPLPLTLRRGASKAEAPKRPQNPTRPYPYREVEVAYDNPAAPGVRLAGTLTLPPAAGSYPVALLITGSGPQDRDETLLGHKPFLVLSDYLTRHGIAVLRLDDRGIAKSTGDFKTATSADFATDVEAGIAYLKTLPEIDHHDIGLIGHSEGAMIAPMVASRNPDVAWIVMLAGPGIPGGDLLVLQQGLIMKAQGAPEASIEKLAASNKKVYAILRSEKNPEIASREVIDALKDVGVPQGTAEAQAKALTAPWFRYFIDYDPATALRNVKCPVLALSGEKDLQVPPKQDLPAIREALTAAHNKDFQVVELPDLNHLFQTAKTGAPSEYSTIEETMSPVALNAISEWIGKHTHKS